MINSTIPRITAPRVGAPFDTTETEEWLLSCLLLPESGADTLQLCRDAGITATSFIGTDHPDLYGRIARGLDEGLREQDIIAAICGESPQLLPILKSLTTTTRPATNIRVKKYIVEIRSREKQGARDLCFKRYTEAQLDSNANPAELARLQAAYITHLEDNDASLTAGEFATDLDASLRFVATHSRKLRYCPGVGWLCWDKRRWEHDGGGHAVELSKLCARDWTTQCLRYFGVNGHNRIKSALSLESANHLKAAIELARSDPRLAVRVAELDSDPWKLNVLNGTLDLRTGELKPHDRTDLITKLAPVIFDPLAKHATIDRYLEMIEANASGMADFLARCFGAALTGDASPESLFLLQGDGGSGKTTLVEGMSAMMGDYAVKLTFESFCQSKHGRSPGAASPDLITLRGSRLAYASEGDKSARLDAGVVKTLTGNEPITARALYSEAITFPQTWKLWLVSNFGPKANSEDTGIWRRMLKLPFDVIPEELRDPEVKRVLTTDPNARSALLAWALRGCIEWQDRGGGRIGLAPPEAVQAATNDYRIKQDTLSEWWDDLLSADAELIRSEWAPVGELRRHYVEWCNENGALPVYVKRFNQYLETHDLVKVRGTAGAKRWQGIKMKN